jgi:myo-inositol 2-dehydrogenase / D-chiro-inositol 1-dehydrogenase
MLRGGIIGLGNVAMGAHAPGWTRRPDVEIVAVTDVRPERRGECAALLPGAAWYDSAEALIAGASLDFVDICTPPSSHAQLIGTALEGGLHVLCEKPLVCSPEALAALAPVAAARGRVLHTVHNWHQAPIVTRTAGLVAQGAIGHVERIVWRTLRTAPAAVRGEGADNWRVRPDVAGGGVLTDHGWHVFYLVVRWIGEAPTAVRARLETRRHLDVDVEDTAAVELTFPRATAEIFLTWAATERQNWAELVGSEGRIELRDDTLVLTRGTATERWSCPPALSSGSVHPEWFDPVARQFVAAITHGEASNLAEASLCATLESLARESSRCDGRTLAIPPAAP